MPRIHPRSILKALSINPLLAQLLPVCRDLQSAGLELRWLQEHAIEKQTTSGHTARILKSYVQRRARGEPLQYILGSEYFGELEIKCRPGVLIPRQETAASVTYLVNLLAKSKQGPSKLKVLDLCSGSGCIPLLFHHDFYSHAQQQNAELKLTGIDISQTALALAQKNHANQLKLYKLGGASASAKARSLGALKFLRADVLGTKPSPVGHAPMPVVEALEREAGGLETPQYDIVISNPPYISSEGYWTTAARSVRTFEPKLALVPLSSSQAECFVEDGDLFYPRLLEIAHHLNTKVALFEVADMEQAVRVVDMARDQGVWDGLEIWRDYPTAQPTVEEMAYSSHADIKVVGSGNGRSVLLFRESGATWLGK